MAPNRATLRSIHRPVEDPVAEGLALIAGAVFATVTDDRTMIPSGIKNINLLPSYFFVRL
jgi:hypothetical protein